MEKEEIFNFDKFVDDICQRENNERSTREDLINEQEEHPVRKLNRLYREHWQNRTRGRGHSER